jgi:predicted nucleotidyltransferase
MKSDASGRFVLRLPPGIHQALRKEALRKRMSLNAVCKMALEAYVSSNTRLGPEETAIPSIVARIQQILGDALIGVVLFGSAARGESREGSDIDLLIVVRGDKALSRNLYSLWDERFGSIQESPHFVHIPASPMEAGSIWLEAAVDGAMLFDRERAVTRFLGNIRRLITAGKLRRRWAHGHPYWVKATGGKEYVQ